MIVRRKKTAFARAERREATRVERAPLSASSRRPDRARKQLAQQCTTIIDISIFVFIATAVASSAVAAAFRV